MSEALKEESKAVANPAGQKHKTPNKAIDDDSDENEEELTLEDFEYIQRMQQLMQMQKMEEEEGLEERVLGSLAGGSGREIEEEIMNTPISLEEIVDSMNPQQA